MNISRLAILAAVALGIVGGLGFSTLAHKESASEEPALAAPVPMVAMTDGMGRTQATELRGGDVFSRIPAIVARVQPAVVSVRVRTSEGGAEGSGVVFDGRRGLVVTNSHVVADATDVDQHAFIANIVITPLALVGGVFYSARTLDKPWSTLTRIDPLYYLVDATRAGLTGFHEAPVWISLLVAAAVALAAFMSATALHRCLHPRRTNHAVLHAYAPARRRA